MLVVPITLRLRVLAATGRAAFAAVVAAAARLVAGGGLGLTRAALGLVLRLTRLGRVAADGRARLAVAAAGLFRTTVASIRA